MNGKKLTKEQIRQLVTNDRTSLIKGFKKRNDTAPYNACLVLTNDFKIRLEFNGPINGKDRMIVNFIAFCFASGQPILLLPVFG